MKILTGKVVVLNFGFVGCKLCIEEMPLLNEFVQQYKGNPDVVFLVLAYDDQKQEKKFLEKAPFAYQVILETNSYNAQLGIDVYPTQLVVNKNGIIEGVSIGTATNTKKILIESIEKALN